MKILLDTHILLWWLFDDQQLSKTARSAIAEPKNTILISSASAYEIALKFAAGKIPSAAPLLADFGAILAENNFIELPISIAAAIEAGNLDWGHRDPFDRLLVAQAELLKIPLVTNDREIVKSKKIKTIF